MELVNIYCKLVICHTGVVLAMGAELVNGSLKNRTGFHCRSTIVLPLLVFSALSNSVLALAGGWLQNRKRISLHM